MKILLVEDDETTANTLAEALTFPQTTENGLSLLAELARTTPKIPVLVMTGRNQLSDRVEVATPDLFMLKLANDSPRRAS
jgi:DNA-binding response OmpR family regulator